MVLAEVERERQINKEEPERDIGGEAGYINRQKKKGKHTEWKQRERERETNRSQGKRAGEAGVCKKKEEREAERGGQRIRHYSIQR